MLRTTTPFRAIALSAACSRPYAHPFSPAVDPYEFGIVPASFSQAEIEGLAFHDGKVLKNPDGSNYATNLKSQNAVEFKPHFYEWATATSGMLAVARKQRSTFRNYVAAETAAPVIACAAGKGPLDELDFQFAGVVRSNSVRTMCAADAQRIYQQSPPPTM